MGIRYRKWVWGEQSTLSYVPLNMPNSNDICYETWFGCNYHTEKLGKRIFSQTEDSKTIHLCPQSMNSAVFSSGEIKRRCCGRQGERRQMRVKVGFWARWDDKTRPAWGLRPTERRGMYERNFSLRLGSRDLTSNLEDGDNERACPTSEAVVFLSD